MNRLRLTCLVLALGVCSPASGLAQSRRPIDVRLGVSIGGVSLGMTRAAVIALGYRLVPEGVARAIGTGWLAGPLLVLVDDSDRVTLVSVELRQSGGVRVAGRAISPRATLPQIARSVPGCNLSSGSGGRVLTCRGPGGVTHFYDSYMNQSVTVMLP